MFDIILAHNENFGIGLNGVIPWHCPSDLKLFREKTLDGILIVGRKTAESLPKLDRRIVITISRTSSSNLRSDHVVASFSEALNLARERYKDRKIFVAGGAEIYRFAMTFQREIGAIHVSYMKGDISTCDTFFNLQDYITPSDWFKIEETDYEGFTHIVLQRKNKGEQQYLDLVSEILQHGEKRIGRNGETASLFGRNLIFDLREGFPLLTTKKMFFRGVVEELLFFLRGETDSKILEEKGVCIWKGNTSRQFLDENGMENRKEGIMGPLYGYQWRFYNADYDEESGKPKDNGGKGIDQLKNVVETIRGDPYSRRILLTDFNPIQAKQGVLYPCHSIIIQFYVSNSCLDAFCYNRSQDVFLGTPFNIASSALLLTLIAKITGLTPRFLHLGLGDVHIYRQHYSLAEEQTRRKAFTFPALEIGKELREIQDVESLQYTDLVLLDYRCHSGIKAEMVA